MQERWRTYWREVRRELWYLPVGMLLAFVPLLFNPATWQGGGDWRAGLQTALIFGLTVPLTIWLLYCATFAAFTCLNRSGRIRLRWPFHVGINTLGAVTGIWLSLLLKAALLGGDVEAGLFLPTLVFSGFVGLLFFLHNAYRAAREEALTLRATVAETRYHTLEQQMRPHFLFNSLNSLAELIESGQENAADVAYTLSDLYRQILTNSKTKTASLQSEIEIVRAYLELEKLRFGPRLDFTIDAPDDAANIYVPSLALQTLVENAVKHGVARSVEGGGVAVHVGRDAQGLYQLRVVNSGAPYRANGNADKAGTGLANTRARLDLLYGEAHQFRIAEDEAGRTAASFYFTGEKID